jgi:energy-coupling factor transporter ATP-binding protein EcfA2
MAIAPILGWEGLGLIQGSGWLFRDIDLFIAPRDRLALIGRNGAGKTTLLRLIAGQIEADKGKRTIQPGTKVVLLEQDPFFTGYATLLDFALPAASGGGHRYAVHSPPNPISCCSTSRPTTSIWARSTGWKTGFRDSRAPSSRSATTAPSSPV